MLPRRILSVASVYIVLHGPCATDAERFRLTHRVRNSNALTHFLGHVATETQRQNTSVEASTALSETSSPTSPRRRTMGCNGLAACFNSCPKKCKTSPKPYCLLKRKVASTNARGLDSIVPCKDLSGVEGIRSVNTAKRWEFLWTAAKKEAAHAKQQRRVDVLHINSFGFRKKNHAHIHFCRLNDWGMQMKSELSSVCSKTDSWESFSLAKCRDVFAIPASDDVKVFSTVQQKYGLNLKDVGISLWLDVCPGKTVVMGTVRCSVEYLLCDRHWFNQDQDDHSYNSARLLDHAFADAESHRQSKKKSVVMPTTKSSIISFRRAESPVLPATSMSSGTISSRTLSSRRAAGCKSLSTCFSSCPAKCEKGTKPYCLLTRTVQSSHAKGLDSMVPCEHLSGMEGIQSKQSAYAWEFLWTAAKDEAARIERQRRVDVLHISPLGFRKRNHAQIIFCRLNDKGLQLKYELKPICANLNSWESFGLGKCRDVFTFVGSDDLMVFSTVQEKFGPDLKDVGISLWLDVCPGKTVVMTSARCSVNSQICDRSWFKH